MFKYQEPEAEEKDQDELGVPETPEAPEEEKEDEEEAEE